MKAYSSNDKFKYLFNGKSAEENMVEILRERQKETFEQLQERNNQQKQQQQVKIDNEQLTKFAAKAIEEAINKAIK